ncbi:hypothetical protein [Undibacterium sp.]|uniref:hypothetical protein n=1 Tax=Undibacterium sp. TaxID=1914977 RepID=UPI00374DA59B
MTSVSSINRSAALYTPPANTAAATSGSAATAVSTPTPSAIVTLTSAQNLPSMLASASTPLMWESKSGDPLSYLMAYNFSFQAPTGRFTGLGSAMLDQIKDGVTNISQTVQQGVAQGVSSTQANPYAGTDGTGGAGAIISAQQPSLHGVGANQVELNITTKSGVKVSLTLDSQDNGLAIQMKADGPLSDSERSALANLSKGFQAAIDGIASDPPKIQLDGLTQFDPNVLASVDLHAAVQASGNVSQSVDFHADAAKRTVSLSGPSGEASISVDLSKPASWGSQAQQAKATASYLKQFDQASSRGHGDASLMAMFKDAFTEMNSNYGKLQPQSALLPSITLADQDHAMLTGLADFSASVTQTATSPNPMRAGEKDSFSYQTSQSTSIKGADQSSREISQTQQSALQARYHESDTPDIPLRLTTAQESQNYNYYTINDTASSTMDMAYKKGILVTATLSQSASQSTRHQKYVMGHLKEDTTTPVQSSLTQDLVKTLAPDTKTDDTRTPLEQYQRTQMLASTSDMILLQTDPSRLIAEKQALSAPTISIK